MRQNLYFTGTAQEGTHWNKPLDPLRETDLAKIVLILVRMFFMDGQMCQRLSSCFHFILSRPLIYRFQSIKMFASSESDDYH